MTLFGNLRGWSGALLAAFLTLALMTPTMDIFLCGGENELAAAGQILKVASTGDESGQPQQNQDEERDCAHGHSCCHHGAWVEQLGHRPGFAVALSYVDFSQAIYSRPPSPPPVTLLRPPRA